MDPEMLKQTGFEGPSLGQKAKEGLWLLASSNAAFQLASWVITILTVRFLTPDDYGLMALAETFVPYLFLVATLDMVDWIVQERHFDETARSTAWIMSLSLGTAVTCLSLLFAPLISSFYQKQDLKYAFIVIGFSFIFRAAASVPDGELRRSFRFKPLAATDCGVGIARGLLQLGLAYAGFGFWSLVIGFLLRDVFRTLLLVFIQGLPKKWIWSSSVARRALSFGLPAALATALWVVYSTADNLIVSKLFGFEMLGFYSMAFYLIDLPLAKLNTVLFPVLLPYYSKLKDDLNSFERKFLSTVQSYALITLPIIAGLGLVAGEIIPLFLGESWLGAIVPLQVMSAVGVLRAIGTCLPPVFRALGKPRYVLYGNIFGALAFPISVLVLARSFGMPGVYSSWFIIMPLLTILSLYFLRKAAGTSIFRYLQALAFPLAATVFMVLVVLFLSKTLFGSFGPVPLLVCKITSGALCYGVCSFLYFRRDLWPMLFSLGMDVDRG